MRLRAAIFDLDCTLTDRRKSIEKYLPKFLSRFPQCVNGRKSGDLVDCICQADRAGYRSREEFAAEVLETLKWSDGPDVAEFVAMWREQFYECAVEANDATKILNALREEGLKLGIITNGGTHGQNAKIDALKLRGLFDAIIVSDTVGVKKPDAQIFRLALDALKVNANETVFVGDHPTADIVGARDVGITPIWVEGVHDWPVEHERPARVIRRLCELPPILRAL
jgi:putative hydrolase of the HAD superfamily